MSGDHEEPTDSVWRVVSTRDRHWDGHFVYVAVTTSIYCRPSCPARLPRRRNVRVLHSADEAERRGYVACLRCHPSPGSLAPAEKSVRAALEYIEAHLDSPLPLVTLSRVVGLSPNHLQQTFTRIVGLSPKTYCDFRRLARLRQCLRAGESIANAIYGAGYGSTRSVYERARKMLGMTPAAYRGGARGQRVAYATYPVRLGRALIARTDQGICGVFLGDADDELVAALEREFSRAAFILEDSSDARLLAALERCEREDPLLSKLDVRIRREAFQARLWHELSS